jgi:hypothetical protein
MYFINILRLAVRYLKNSIPLDKDLLSQYIQQIDNPHNITQIDAWLELVKPLNMEFSQTIQRLTAVFTPVFEVCLNLDAWLGGVDYTVLEQQKYLDFLVSLVNQSHNLAIQSTQILSEENYHILQQQLNLLLRDILKVLSHTPPVNYTQEIIKQWLSNN